MGTRPGRSQLALAFAGCLVAPTVSSCSKAPGPRRPQQTKNSGNLDSLARELRELRALPTSAPTNARCPADPKIFEGVDQGTLSALGEPDYIPRGESTWVYFFTSPRPEGQFGGGFPELSFVFGPDGRVSRVICHYAK